MHTRFSQASVTSADQWTETCGLPTDPIRKTTGSSVHLERYTVPHVISPDILSTVYPSWMHGNRRNSEGGIVNYEGGIANDEGEIANDEGGIANDEGGIENEE